MLLLFFLWFHFRLLSVPCKYYSPLSWNESKQCHLEEGSQFGMYEHFQATCDPLAHFKTPQRNINLLISSDRLF